MKIIDKRALDEFFQGDAELLADLATIFTQHLPDMDARMRVAIADRDAEALHEVAHQLKSRLGYFAAAKLQSIAREMEACGRDGRIDDGAELLEPMLSGCRDLLVELSDHTGLSLVVAEE